MWYKINTGNFIITQLKNEYAIYQLNICKLFILKDFGLFIWNNLDESFTFKSIVKKMHKNTKYRINKYVAEYQIIQFLKSLEFNGFICKND